MSSPPPSPNDLTRQQLDELDALLQRMLNLPLSATPESVPASPPRFTSPPLPTLPAETPPISGGVPSDWRMDLAGSGDRVPHLMGSSPAPKSSPVMPVSAERRPVEPVAESPPSWAPDPLARYLPTLEVSAEPPRPPEPEPPVSTGTLRGVDAPALPPGYRSARADLPPLEMPIPPRAPFLLTLPLEEESATRPPRLSPILWPLAAINWILETLLSLLGPVGGMFMRPLGKNMLAVVGLLLLLAAGAWTAHGLGLIKLTLPIPLPVPRTPSVL